MLKAILVALTLLGSIAHANLDPELASIAKAHLQSLGIQGKSFDLEQDTALNQMYMAKFATGTEEFPCHVGVVVNKKEKKVTMGEGDPDLKLYFPYTDTFPDRTKKIYQFCAD